MRHGIEHNKLGRGTAHRKSMIANMAVSLIKHGRIETTLNRAKAIRRVVEKLVTRSKNDSLHARRLVRSKIRDLDGVKLLFENVAPRFKTRNGGYTRILKKSTTRMGDAAEMAFLEFVDYVLPEKKTKESKAAKKDKKSKAEEKELEKQALASGAKGSAKATPRSDSKKISTSAASGQKKNTNVRKTSSS